MTVIPLLIIYWPFALYTFRTFRIEVRRQQQNKTLIYNQKQLLNLEKERDAVMDEEKVSVKVNTNINSTVEREEEDSKFEDHTDLVYQENH